MGKNQDLSAAAILTSKKQQAASFSLIRIRVNTMISLTIHRGAVFLSLEASLTISAVATLGLLQSGTLSIIQHFTGQLDVVVSELAYLAVVDTEDFGFFRGAEGEPGDEVHDEKDQAGADEGVGGAGE